MNQPSTVIAIFDVMNAETPASTGTVSAKTGASLITLGYAETGETNSLAEVWHPAGLISIPALPNANNNNLDAAQCLAFVRNDQNIAFAFRDTRTELLAGKIGPGETCLYGSNSKALEIIKNDDSITRLTKDANGNLLQDTLDPTGWHFASSFGSIILDATGFHVITQSGASLHLGGVTVNPVYPTYCNINAASINASGFVSTLVSAEEDALLDPTVAASVSAIAAGTTALAASSATVITVAADAAALLPVGTLATLTTYGVDSAASIVALQATLIALQATVSALQAEIIAMRTEYVLSLSSSTGSV